LVGLQLNVLVKIQNQVNWKANTGQQIQKLYAWVAIESDGGEGICAFLLGDTQMPMVGADKLRMESLRPMAEFIREKTGYPIRLVEFSTRCVLEDLK
jgi:hypothetical protein